MTSMPFACVALATVVAGGCDLSAAGDDARATFDRALQVNGSVTLHLTNGSGSLKIAPGSADAVRVVGHIRAGESGSDALRAAQRAERLAAQPPIRQDGNVIRVGDIEDPALRQRVAIDYEITVPVQTRVDSRSGSGDQWIGAIDGPVVMAAGSGDVSVGPLSAGVTAQVGSGDVTIRGAHGAVTVNAASGNLRAYDVDGRLAVRTASGDVEVTGLPQDTWTIETASGDVDLTLPSTAAFVLNATTSSGDLSLSHADVEQERSERGSLSATVRGGGPRITVSTASGSVRVD